MVDILLGTLHEINHAELIFCIDYGTLRTLQNDMDEERIALIKRYLERGEDINTIKSALIAQGHTSEHFEDDLARATGSAADAPAQTASGEAFGITSLILTGFAALWNKRSVILLSTSFAALSAVTIQFFWSGPGAGAQGLLMFLGFGLSLIGGAVFVLSFATLLHATTHYHEHIALSISVQWALRHLSHALWLSLVCALCFATLSLLIVPGLFFLIFMPLCFVVFVREDTRGVFAILRTIDLVRYDTIGAFFKSASAILVSGVYLCVGLGATLLLLPFLGHNLFISVAAYALFWFFIVSAVAVMHTIFSRMVIQFISVRPVFDLYVYRHIKWLLRAILVCGVFAITLTAVGTGLYQQLVNDVQTMLGNASTSLVPQRQSEESSDLTLSDRVLKTQLISRKASARLYGSRLGSYDTVCRGITITKPIECLESDRSFVLQAPLSDGRYFCVDGNGFEGTIALPSRTSEGCQ